METDLYEKAYDNFVASLDMPTRDAVTKLMIHTRTRPDDPHMVGVCLTAVATKTNAATQAHVLQAQQTTLEALETFRKSPDLERNLHHISSLKQSLDLVERFSRDCVAIWGMGAACIAVLWFASMAFAWNTGYNWARGDVHAATHEVVCNDLYQYIDGTSAYWRKSLHMSAAADHLAGTVFKDCPR